MAQQNSLKKAKDLVAEVKKQIDQYQMDITQSITHLLYEEGTDKRKMTSLLCKGIIGLSVGVGALRDLQRKELHKQQREGLTKFVEKEMERVRKQYGLKKSDVYNKE